MRWVSDGALCCPSLLTSLARATVVKMRSCSTRAVTRFLSMRFLRHKRKHEEGCMQHHGTQGERETCRGTAEKAGG